MSREVVLPLGWCFLAWDRPRGQSLGKASPAAGNMPRAGGGSGATENPPPEPGILQTVLLSKLWHS